MNKYLLIILALLIIVIFASGQKDGGIVGIGTNHFDNGEISFDYPDTWNKTNGTGSNVVSFTDANGLNVKVFRLRTPPNYNLSRRINLDAAGTIDKNFLLVSKENITVNGTTAYKRDFNVTGKNGTHQRREVWIERNNLIYSIILTAPEGVNVNSVDVLISSLKINDSAATPKYSGWAEIIIPDIDARWKFCSQSVNTPGAVFHVPYGYFPGGRGQMALLGHRTTRHAPFLHISKLDPGDRIIINDFLTQKKYIYQVTQNDDIRWGVKWNDIDYQASEEPQLLLITCHPPGFARAALIVHSRLVDVEPLN
ncbi:MAG: sortase [Methanobacteriaceae archaeon]